eukprot:SAG11_NODE_32741_length_281_cov_0.840659_2_plen_38_part_01
MTLDAGGRIARTRRTIPTTGVLKISSFFLDHQLFLVND